jgi:hypothetical protein
MIRNNDFLHVVNDVEGEEYAVKPSESGTDSAERFCRK